MPRFDRACAAPHVPATTVRALAFAGVLTLAGCATAPTATTTVPGTPTGGSGPLAPIGGVPSEADANAALATERQWLQQWFKGTPVQIGQRRDGPVTIEVPREFSFDAGKATVKPALGAVLDKVAESLRRSSMLRLAQIAAPGDAAGDPLGPKRAAALRAHLVGRGVPALQLGAPEAGAQPAVQLRLEATATH